MCTTSMCTTMTSDLYKAAINALGLTDEVEDPLSDVFDNYEIWSMICQNPKYTAQTRELEENMVFFVEKNGGDGVMARVFNAEVKTVLLTTQKRKILMTNGKLTVIPV